VCVLGYSLGPKYPKRERNPTKPPFEDIQGLPRLENSIKITSFETVDAVVLVIGLISKGFF